MPKTILITGCSQGGIGYALAKKFQAYGYVVIATARRTESIKLLDEAGMTVLPLEVTSEESIQSCAEKVKQMCPEGLEFLINNAGVVCTIPALDVEMEDARRCFDTNFFSIVRLVQVFTPMLIQAKGTIVMIGSLASEMPYVFGSIYNASKAALLSYADTLRVELAPFDISVITVMTGGVKSQLTKKVQRFVTKDSMYAPIEEDFTKRKTHSADVGMDTDEYAEQVVKQLLPGSGPWPWRLFMRDARRRWVWAGGSSSLVWLLSAGWWWHGLYDWYFTRKFKLNVLKTWKQKKV